MISDIKCFYERDHSDGMWNESQTTVLHVDSGTENGTVIRLVIFSQFRLRFDCGLHITL